MLIDRSEEDLLIKLSIPLSNSIFNMKVKKRFFYNYSSKIISLKDNFTIPKDKYLCYKIIFCIQEECHENSFNSIK